MNTLQIVSYVSLGIALICSVIIAIDILSGNAQHMWIMNIVWPVTALYSGVFGLIAYYALGKKSSKKNMQHMHMQHGDMQMQQKKSVTWRTVVKGTLHCGAGCTLGDIIVETLLLVVTITILSNDLYNKWLIDFIAAFLIGILFQYYAIKPMRKISSGEALKAALKADTLSLICWQVGMYGWMAIAIFLIFHYQLKATEPLFWFMMQIAMIVGFFCAFPINWWLIKKGIKEAM